MSGWTNRRRLILAPAGFVASAVEGVSLHPSQAVHTEYLPERLPVEDPRVVAMSIVGERAMRASLRGLSYAQQC
jgi:hypothetical protein